MYVALSFPPSLSPLLIPSPLLVFAVLFYHGGCWLEYKLGIQDTARVVPVHGVWYVSPHSVLIPRTHLHEVLGPGNETRVYPHIYSGLWSLIGTALFLGGTTAECNLHAAFEGLCYCHLRLPPLVRHHLHMVPV